MSNLNNLALPTRVSLYLFGGGKLPQIFNSQVSH